MTGAWLELPEAAARLSRAWGVHVSMDQVLALGRHDVLIVRFQHGYHSVLEESVTALAACGGDDQTEKPRPAVRGGPDIGDEAEALYREEKRT